MMRFSSTLFVSLALLVATSNGYAPRAPVSAAARSPLFASIVAEPAIAHDVADNVSSKIQTVLEKADDLLLNRAMRFVNHAPIIVTLTALLKQVGSTRFGLDIAPSALSIASPAGLAVPTWYVHV